MSEETEKILFFNRLQKILRGCSISKESPLTVEIYSQTRGWENAQKTADKLVKLLVAIRDWEGKNDD